MSTMTGVVPGVCPAGVTHTISLLLRLEEQEMTERQERKIKGDDTYECCWWDLTERPTPEGLERDLQYFGADALTGYEIDTENKN